MPFDTPCTVIEHRAVGNGLYVLLLAPTTPNFYCVPGQFLMIDLPTDQFYFRRPMSVLSLHENGQFDVFYRVVGKGTQKMARSFLPGTTATILAPLGRGFQISPELKADPSKLLLIGGGIGIAPLFFAASFLNSPGRFSHSSPVCVYGCRSQQDIGIEPELTTLIGKDNLHIATDDGSAGFKGNVCQFLETKPELMEQASTAFICGPNPMMAAAVRLLQQRNPSLSIQVSLEGPMPCGTGACFGCVVDRAVLSPETLLTQPIKACLPSRVCTDGPVYFAQDLRWGQRGPLSPGEKDRFLNPDETTSSSCEGTCL